MVGAFRSVGVEWLAKPVSSSPADFYPFTGSVHFEEEQRNADLIMYIVDDEEVEFMETFTIQLVGTTGKIYSKYLTNTIKSGPLQDGHNQFQEPNFL